MPLLARRASVGGEKCGLQSSRSERGQQESEKERPYERAHCPPRIGSGEVAGGLFGRETLLDGGHRPD